MFVRNLVSKEEARFGLFSFRYSLRFGSFCTGNFDFIFSCVLFKTETRPSLFLFWIRDMLFGCSHLYRVDFFWAQKNSLFQPLQFYVPIVILGIIPFLGQWHSYFTLTFGIYLKQSGRSKRETEKRLT